MQVPTAADAEFVQRSRHVRPFHAVRLPIPNSIAQLLLTGFALVAIPLLIALFATFAQVNRLAAQSRDSIVDATTATHLSQAAHEYVVAMERGYRQFVLTGEARVLEIYRENRRRLTETLPRLAALKFDETHEKLIERIRLADVYLNEHLVPGGKPRLSEEQASASFAELSGLTRELVQRNARAVETQAANTIGATARLINAILLQAVAMMVAAFLLAIIFVYLIIRPLQQVRNRIMQLGSADFDTPIDVQGPRDIQEIGRRLEWLRQRMKELEHQKQTLLRHVSHELKTPLTSIREGAELLVESSARSLAAEDRKIIEILQSSSIRLQRLIENLLETVKSDGLIRNGPSPPPILLQPIIRNVIDSQFPAVTAKDLVVDVACTDRTFAIDANQFSVIIDNLLSNAVRFSPSRGVIRIEVAIDDAGLNVVVQDAGPGISDIDAEKIFEPFYRGAGAVETKVAGTGLGLSIVRDYVERLGGSVKLERGAVGADFRIHVPPPAQADSADAA